MGASGGKEQLEKHSAKPVSIKEQGKREWLGFEMTGLISGEKGNQKKKLWHDKGLYVTRSCCMITGGVCIDFRYILIIFW